MAGDCTHFCQYRLFTKVIAWAVAVLSALCVGVALGAPDGPARVRDTGIAVGIFLAVIIPAIIIANRREPE